VDHFAVEHRALDDLHGHTVMVSMPHYCGPRAALALLLAPNIAARERSTLPSQLPWRRDPETYGEAMTDADSDAQLGAARDHSDRSTLGRRPPADHRSAGAAKRHRPGDLPRVDRSN
jgi:hypothetical protein